MLVAVAFGALVGRVPFAVIAFGAGLGEAVGFVVVDVPAPPLDVPAGDPDAALEVLAFGLADVVPLAVVAFGLADVVPLAVVPFGLADVEPFAVTAFGPGVAELFDVTAAGEAAADAVDGTAFDVAAAAAGRLNPPSPNEATTGTAHTDCSNCLRSIRPPSFAIPQRVRSVAFRSCPLIAV